MSTTVRAGFPDSGMGGGCPEGGVRVGNACETGTGGSDAGFD
jgi:hypothetical protein